MPAVITLTNKYNAYQRRRMQRAFQLVEERFEEDSIVPEDTGRLKDGTRVINQVIAAPRYSGIAVSRAINPDGGADYAAILEAAPRIAPRRAKYISFIARGGERVFSKGFDNSHYRWWTRFWGQQPNPWQDAIIRSGQEVQYR